MFIEGHHHGGGAVFANLLRVLEKLRLAFFERNRIHNAFALNTLQSGFDNRPLGRIDHQRHARDVGLGGDQIQKCNHRLLAIEHGLVHIDVDDLRAAFDLLARDVQCLVVFAVEHQFFERGRAGDIGALADVDEETAARDVERLVTA